MKDKELEKRDVDNSVGRNSNLEMQDAHTLLDSWFWWTHLQDSCMSRSRCRHVGESIDVWQATLASAAR